MAKINTPTCISSGDAPDPFNGRPASLFVAEQIAALTAERDALRAQVAALTAGWQPMDKAPTDGTNCLLAIKHGPFVYAIQGAYMSGKWMNAANIDSPPLCWRPALAIPRHFLPWNND